MDPCQRQPDKRKPEPEPWRSNSVSRKHPSRCSGSRWKFVVKSTALSLAANGKDALTCWARNAAPLNTSRARVTGRVCLAPSRTFCSGSNEVPMLSWGKSVSNSWSSSTTKASQSRHIKRLDPGIYSSCARSRGDGSWYPNGHEGRSRASWIAATMTGLSARRSNNATPVQLGGREIRVEFMVDSSDQGQPVEMLKTSDPGIYSYRARRTRRPFLNPRRKLQIQHAITAGLERIRQLMVRANEAEPNPVIPPVLEVPDPASAEEYKGIRPEFAVSTLEKLYPRTACRRR